MIEEGGDDAYTNILHLYRYQRKCKVVKELFNIYIDTDTDANAKQWRFVFVSMSMYMLSDLFTALHLYQH